MPQQDLDKIAQLALNSYKGNFPSITFFAKETSTIYKIVDTASQEFALKIYDGNSNNLTDNLLEVLILEAIQAKGSISIAELIYNKDGQPFTIYKDMALNTTYRMALSKWLKGVDFNDNESKERFIQLGKLVAELHLITKNIVIPNNLPPKKWDEVFYFRDEKAVYHEAKYQQLVSSEFKELMDTAIPLLNQKLQEIYHVDTPQLLHGDLNPWNIKIHNNELSILDFEDAILGQPVQDLAILLYYYQDNKNFSYDFVKDCVLEGYTSICAVQNFTEHNLEVLSMARRVNFLNYVLTLEGDYQQFIKEGLSKLKAFLS